MCDLIKKNENKWHSNNMFVKLNLILSKILKVYYVPLKINL